MHAKDFLRMFAYDDWANRECLTAMRAANPLPADASDAWLTFFRHRSSGWNAS